MSKKIEKSTSIRGLEEEHQTFNEGQFKSLFTTEQNVDLNTLYEVVKKTPEVVGCIQAILEDIMADGWRFEGGKNKIIDTRKFIIKSDFYKLLSNAIFDLIVTGNAYILKLSVNDEELKSILRVIGKGFAKTLCAQVKKQRTFELIKQKIDKPQDLQLLKSSTMKINFDETGRVKSYQQIVKGVERIYMPSDIIHLSLINIGGSPYGFTPLEPLLSDVATLIFAKEYAGKFFENDGIPHFIFKLINDGPESPNVKKLRQEFKELKKKANKFRSLIITGELDVEQIQRFNKDMEYSKLIAHFTQIVLIALGVPSGRINFSTSSGTRQAAEETQISREGYYKKISWLQKLLENSLNKELFGSFGAELIFRRAYKIDEMREAQIGQIASQAGFMTINEIRDRIGLEPEMPNEPMAKPTGDNMRINFREDQKQRQGKQDQQNPDQNMDNRVKTIKRFQNVVDVEFPEFVKIVENSVEGVLGQNAFVKAKIIYEENDTNFVLYFNDTTWIYRSIIPKSSVNVEEFRFERLRNAVKIRF